MENKDYVVAIDLGTTKVATVVGRQVEGGKISIVATAVSESEGVLRGELKNVEQVAKAVKETVTKIEQELDIRIREAYVGITGAHINCSKHSGYVFIENNDNEVKEKDVQRLNESMKNVQISIGETIIHILPQSYIIDNEPDIKEPVGMIGKKLDGTFNIITADRASINRVEKCLSKIDIRVSHLILNSLAISESVLIDDEKELGVAVVDIGGGTTDLCVYFDNTVRHVAAIPIGGTLVNKDIRSYGILERYVESLKVKFGSALSDEAPADKFITIPGINNSAQKEISFKNLAAIIEARMLDVIECIEAELKRCGYANKLVAGIVLTGGGSQIKGIDELFKRKLGYNVRLATPTVRVEQASISKIDSPVYSTAVGLLLKGISIGKGTLVEKVKVTTQPQKTQPAPQPFGQPSEPLRQQQQYQSSQKIEDDDQIEDQIEDTEDDDTTKGKGGKKKLFGGLIDKFNNMFEPINDSDI